MKKTKSQLTDPKILFALFFLCALFLRLTNLYTWDLWFDELGTNTYTSDFLRKLSNSSGIPISSLFANKLKNDPHSSFYFTTVNIFSHIFSGGKSLRIISVFFSMLSLGIFYKLSRLFFTQKTSIYALIIVMIHPFHLWYAQEARVYAMACFFSLLTVFSCFKAFKTNKNSYWLTFIGAGILSLNTDYFSGILIVLTGTFLFSSQYRENTKKWLLSIFTISVIFLLFQSTLIDQLDFVKNNFWLPKPSKISLLFTWRVFSLGYSANTTQYHLSLLLFSALFLLGSYSYFRKDRLLTTILLLLFLFPIAAIYLFSHLVMPVYINRQLFIFSPYYYLFIANGLTTIKNKRIHILVAICTLLLLGTSLFNYYHGYMFKNGQWGYWMGGVFPKKMHSQILSIIEEEFQEDDLIAATEIQSYAMALPYFLKLQESKGNISSESFRFLFFPQSPSQFDKQFLQINKRIKIISEKNINKLHAFFPLIKNQKKIKLEDFKKENYQRIWVISSNWIENKAMVPNATNVRNYMSKNFSKILFKQKDGIYLELFALKDIPMCLSVEDCFSKNDLSYNPLSMCTLLKK